MEKTKLKKLRLQKGITQQQMADCLPTDKSNYSKKENGYIKITDMEWEKLAQKLACEVEDIYEKEEKSVYINSNLNNVGDNNVYNPINEVTLKYIAKLEEENASLKEEIKRLKERN